MLLIESLEYVNVNKVQFEGLVRDLLLVHMYRVEVYDLKSRSITYKVHAIELKYWEKRNFDTWNFIFLLIRVH